jgi:serine/threonine-protein kinase
MSPEQIKGEGRIGTKADLHALGHVAFTMLVGVPYWAPERREVGGLIPFLMRVLRGNPEPASARAARLGAALPATFDAWFEQATAVDPERRFAGAGQMVLELARALGLDAPAILSARKHAHAVRAEPEEGSADGCGAATVARAPSPAVEERTEAPTVGVLPAVRVRSRGKLLAGATVASGLVLVGALLVVRHWTAGPPSLPEASPVHSSFGGSISPAKAASPPERPSPASAAAIASSVEGPASASAAPPSLLVEGSRSRASGAPSRSPAGRTPPSPAPSSVAAKRHDPLETF